MISFCNLIGGVLSEPSEVNGLNPPILVGSFLLCVKRAVSLGTSEAMQQYYYILVSNYQKHAVFDLNDNSLVIHALHNQQYNKAKQ